jgi:hypothetical protein
MNKISTFIIITIMMMISACNGDKTDHELISIDSTLKHHPDSAWKMLNGIKSTDDFTDEEKAYYGLLLTEAAWRTHSHLTSDDLIKGSEEYYSKHDGIDKKARSSLYRGVLLMNKKKYAEAILYMKKAESMISELHDQHLIYQIYEYIGWMNECNGAGRWALTYYQHAYECAKNVVNKKCMLEALLNQSNVLSNMNYNKESYRINSMAAKFINIADSQQKSRIYKNFALYFLMKDSLKNADEYGNMALKFACDTSSVKGALSILIYLYSKDGKSDSIISLLTRYSKINNPILRYNQLRVIYEYAIEEGDYKKALEAYRQLAEISDSLRTSRNNLEIVDIQNKYDQETARREKSEMTLWFTMMIIILLLLIFISMVWFYYRTQKLYKRYRSGIQEIQQEMTDRLCNKNGAIVDLQSRIKMLSESVDAKITKIDQLKKQIKKSPFTHNEYDLNEVYCDVSSMKSGIDILYAILNGSNISQYGKKEETDVTKILWLTDKELALRLEKASQTLTPKETFFCIMERYGKSDDEKTSAFHCSDQALRSIKSRLSKKMEWNKMMKELLTNQYL